MHNEQDEAAFHEAMAAEAAAEAEAAMAAEAEAAEEAAREAEHFATAGEPAFQGETDDF